MKRLIFSSVIATLIISLAAPAGAVFASEGVDVGLSPPIVTDELGTPLAEAAVPEEPGDSEVVAMPLEAETMPMPADIPEQQQALTPRATPAKAAVPAAAEPLATPSAPAVEATTPESAAQPLPPQRKVYVSAFQAVGSLGFVELYNSHETRTQSIEGWYLEVVFTDDSVCEVPLHGYIFPETKVLMTQQGAVEGVQNSHNFSCDEADNRIVKQLDVYDGSVVNNPDVDTPQLIEQLVVPDVSHAVWVRKSMTATYRTGEFSQDFKADNAYSPVDGYWYILPPIPTIQVREVLVSPRDCLPSEDDPACYDFVKVTNTGDDPIDLSLYRLRSGFANASASSSNTTYFSFTLAPGQTRTLTHGRSGERLSMTANDGTVWFEDVEGATVYPTEVPPYIDSNLSSKRGMSWALDGTSDTWRWAVPSPQSVENNFLIDAVQDESNAVPTLTPCRSDQFRNPETNRCKKTASAATLTPCREGQYRSAETNRCRSTATTASSLQPCQPDQFRNPETNRCKKIAVSTGLADCGPGRERHAVTNRCRNVTSDTPPEVGFGVEPIVQPASTFIGWIVLGAVALLAVGYAGWEWRQEIGRLLRRIPGVSRIVK